MAKSWRKRLRRGRLASWLGRIEGVEKPALLVGIGLLLYRVWRNDDHGSNLKSRWRGAIDRVRRRFGARSETTNGATTGSTTTPSSPVPPHVS
jgi:hypothetical protein